MNKLKASATNKDVSCDFRETHADAVLSKSVLFLLSLVLLCLRVVLLCVVRCASVCGVLWCVSVAMSATAVVPCRCRVLCSAVCPSPCLLLLMCRVVLCCAAEERDENQGFTV